LTLQSGRGPLFWIHIVFPIWWSVENLANYIGLLDSAMVMMKEMVIVTNLRREVDFSTLYYIVEHDIVEVGKKKTDRDTHLIVMDAINDVD